MNTWNVYCESAEMGIDGDFRSVLPIGDSWFWSHCREGHSSINLANLSPQKGLNP